MTTFDIESQMLMDEVLGQGMSKERVWERVPCKEKVLLFWENIEVSNSILLSHWMEFVTAQLSPRESPALQGGAWGNR
jgi:hypothetical protein